MTLSLIKKTVFIAALPVLLLSCNGETSYTTRINNLSNDIISFRIYTAHNTTPDTVTMIPGQSYTLSVATNEGKILDIPVCTGNLDSMNAMTLSGKLLTKDILDPDQWTHRMIEDKGQRSVDHYCDFDIFQKDLKY